MKKLLILMVAIMLPNMANAAGQCARYYVAETCSSSYTYTVYGNTNNASISTAKCFGLYENMTPIGSTTPVWTLNRHVKVITSLTCNTGYSSTSAGTLSMCMDDSTGDRTQSLTYYKCVCADQYVWNLDWASYNVATERQSGTLYNCGTSSTVYQYRCASGYYSASGNATMLSLADVDCVSCSSTCGVGHTTGVAGATSYEQCRAPAATDSPTMSAHLNTRRHVVAMIRATPSAAVANHASATLIVLAVRVLPDVVYQLIAARVALHV